MTYTDFLQAKEKHPGVMIAVRVGDFYEFYGQDAETAAEVLQITLTSRGGNPMAGVPYYSVERYLAKLIAAGHKVALCDELEAPKAEVLTYPGGAELHIGDALAVLKTLPSDSIDCIVTSPPYWGLRDYGVDGQIGLEPIVEEWLERTVAVFSEAKRVLKDSGSLWVEMGDCHVDKDLVGQPWMLAFALKSDGWILRRDVILRKTNPMPESAKDRFTTSHVYLFHFTKCKVGYYFNMDAVKEPVTGTANSRGSGVNPKASGWDTTKGEGGHGSIHRSTLGAKGETADTKTVKSSAGSKFGRGAGWRSKQNESFSSSVNELVDSRNRRSVIDISIEPFAGAHFATFSREIPNICISASCPVGGVVMDMFAGSGTVGAEALTLGRKAVLIELNPANIPLIEGRLSKVQFPLGLEFPEVEVLEPEGLTA